MKRTKRTDRGFTLIELVIVITILAILAAVAVPAFQNLTVQARDASTHGALGALRSGIAIMRAENIADGCVANCWPTLAEVTAGNMMENNDIPDNPWCATANGACDPDGVVENTTGTRGVVGGSAMGWAYHPATGLIYANSASSTGGTTENSF